MAFLSKVGNILRQTASKQINNELSASRPSIYQAIRCMSSSKLFVGGISYATDDTSLREAFSKYGEVIEARVILDRETGRSRGFGFITYTSSEEASSAIQALDGQDLHGRRVRVNYANDRARGSFGGGGYGAGGGGYGAGGGYNSNYGGNYGGPRGNYGDSNTSGGGGGYNTNYGGNYGSSGGNYGSDNSSGGGDYAGGNVGYPGRNTFDSSSTGVYGSGSGSDTWNYGTGDGNVASGNVGFAGGNTNESGAGNYGVASGGGGSDNFGGNSLDDSAADDDQDEPLEGNFKDDDDDAGDFAKRA